MTEQDTSRATRTSKENDVAPDQNKEESPVESSEKKQPKHQYSWRFWIIFPALCITGFVVSRHPALKPGMESFLDVQSSTAGCVTNWRAKGTYLAPESISSSPSIGPKSDVWSLGCVISVVFTFLEAGFEGGIRYRDESVHQSPDKNYDRFFVKYPDGTHPAINSWHEHLISEVRERDLHEGEAVKFMDYLEKSVLRYAQAKRNGAREVEGKLLKAFSKYKALRQEGRDKSPVGKQNRSFWHNLLSRRERIAIGSSRHWLSVRLADYIFFRE